MDECNFSDSPKISIIGLGYVGLPLAVELSKYFSVTGFDINTERINQLRNSFDKTGEIESHILKDSSIKYTCEINELSDTDIFIVTVPTPIKEDFSPDLEPLKKASEFIAKVIKKSSVIVYESTVYPGTTEYVCGKILEKISGLKSGTDFYIGYSPERIDPGNKLNNLTNITKIVASQNETVSKYIAGIYGKINNDNVYIASSIAVAEASKIVENMQRDVNIAFINEITAVLSKYGVSIFDVLSAANTKWNFGDYKPGLVGGHCIGVDPYYFIKFANDLNINAKLISTARETNENMSKYLASFVDEKLKSVNKQKKRVVVLGITFKENVKDLRNTKVVDFINALKAKGYFVDVHDPNVDKKEVKALLDVEIIDNIDEKYDCAVLAVAHKYYDEKSVCNFLMDDGIVIDFKNHLDKKKISMEYYTL